MLFIFSIQSQITQRWQRISLKCTELKDKDTGLWPPTPPTHIHLIVFIFKSVYCDYRFPTKQKLHIKSWISRLSKKAQTDRLHKESAEAFIQLIPVRFPVPLMFQLNPPKKDYLQVSQVPAGTSDYTSHPNYCRSKCTNNCVTDESSPWTSAQVTSECKNAQFCNGGLVRDLFQSLNH